MNDSPIQPLKRSDSPESPEPSEALGVSKPRLPPHSLRRTARTPQTIRDTLFTVLFFTLCVIPSVGMLFAGETTPVGNERLSPKPLLTTAEGKWNPKVLSECADYFNDYIAGRHTMITANSTLTASLFRVLTNEDVILGTDGWLYYAETLPDYLGVPRMSERECYAVARTLYLIQQYTIQQGAQFVFTIAPNKNSLYPEHMPTRYPPSDLPHNAERLAARLIELGVSYVDLFAALRSVDETLYYATDSHWNNRGAALAGDVLYGALDATRDLTWDSIRTSPEQTTDRLSSDRFFSTSYTMQGNHKGDLYQMAYPAGTQSEADAIFDRAFTFQYEGNFHSPEDVRILTTNAGKPGSLVMFRDSFGNALHPFLAERFGKALFSRATPYDLTTVAREQADTVVIELVERNVSTLCTRPPIFPAPVCASVFLDTGKEMPIRVGNVATASCQDSDRLMGYCQITGHVVCAGKEDREEREDREDKAGKNRSNRIDEDSLILVQIDGTLYEATPAGEGDDPFTLYVPGTAATIQQTDPIVIVTVNGQETICPLLWE